MSCAPVGRLLLRRRRLLWLLRGRAAPWGGFPGRCLGLFGGPPPFPTSPFFIMLFRSLLGAAVSLSFTSRALVSPARAVAATGPPLLVLATEAVVVVDALLVVVALECIPKR